MNEKNVTERFNVSMKKNVVDMIDNYASEIGVSRSAFITFACVEYLKTRDAMNNLSLVRRLDEQGVFGSHDSEKVGDFD